MYRFYAALVLIALAFPPVESCPVYWAFLGRADVRINYHYLAYECLVLATLIGTVELFRRKA